MMAENLTIIDDDGPDGRAGYDGTSAPLARAERDRLDALDPDRAADRARDAWLAAEKKAVAARRERSRHGAEFVYNLICECGCNHLIRVSTVRSHGLEGHSDAQISALAKKFADLSLASFKAQYPGVKNVSGVDEALGAQPVGHRAQAVQGEQLGRGVVADGDAAGDQPGFGQKGNPSFQILNAVLKVFHQILRRLVGPFDGRAGVGKMTAQSCDPAPATPSTLTRKEPQ